MVDDRNNVNILYEHASLLRIDQLVEAAMGHELLNFMDTYAGYNQIKMDPSDKNKTAFTTGREIYCYKVMPFGLKNAGVTFIAWLTKSSRI